MLFQLIKEAVFKTSITVNLAGVLAKEGKKVLIIDTDNQGNATMSFGYNPDNIEYTLYDVLVDGLPVAHTIINAYENIDIIPSNDDFSFFEFDVLTQGKTYDKPFSLLRNAMSYIQNDYDFVLIDTPPNLGLTQGNVLSYASEILIPFQPEPYSMRSLTKMLKAIQSFKQAHNPVLTVTGVIATLVDRRTSTHAEIIQEARKFCYQNNIPMLDTEIGRAIRYAKNIYDQDLPATLAEKNEATVKEYYKLKGEIC